MATQDDILTAQKNGVIAINNLGQTTFYLAGQSSTKNISAQTTVANGSGRLVRIIVVDGGSGPGTAYAGSATAANAIYTIPKDAGVYDIGVQFSVALIVAPGSGQTVCVVYSMD